MINLIVSETSPRRLINMLYLSYLLSRAIHVAYRIGLFDVLANQDLLVSKLEHKFPKHYKPAIIRLLRFLASHSIVSESEGSVRGNTLTLAIFEMLRQLKTPSYMLPTSELWSEAYDIVNFFYRYPELLKKQPITIDFVNGEVSNQSNVKHQNLKLIFSGTPDAIVQSLLSRYIVTGVISYVVKKDVLNSIAEGYTTLKSLEKNVKGSVEILNYILGLLCDYHILRQNDGGCYELSFLASPFLRDHPSCLVPALSLVDEVWWQATGEFESCIKDGVDTFSKITDRQFFQYLKEKPEAQDRFDKGIANFSKDEDVLITHAINFSPYSSIVDIGGGEGGLIYSIDKKYPKSQKYLYEQKHIAKKTQHILAGKNAEHIEVIAGDFFLPAKQNNLPSDKSLYILKGVLHDFSNDKAQQIITHCLNAMSEDSTLLLLERFLPDADHFHLNQYMDLLMMTLLNGNERSFQDWKALIKQVDGADLVSEELSAVEDYVAVYIRKK